MRTAKQIYQFSHTAAQAGEVTGNFNSTRSRRSLHVPINFKVQTSDIGVAPISPSITAKLQHSHDGTVWTDVPSGGITAITSAGAQAGEINVATQLEKYVRAHVITTFGTVNGGTLVKCFIGGN